MECMCFVCIYITEMQYKPKPFYVLVKFVRTYSSIILYSLSLPRESYPEMETVLRFEIPNPRHSHSTVPRNRGDEGGWEQ